MKPIKCPEVSVIADYLTGELSAPHRQRLEEHVQICTACMQVLNRERALDGLLRHQQLLKAPPGFQKRLLLALEKEDSAYSPPYWLRALGPGLVIVFVGLLVGNSLSGYAGEIGPKIGSFIAGWFNLPGLKNLEVLPAHSLLPQITGSSQMVLLNLAAAGMVLCWVFWHLIKALRK